MKVVWDDSQRVFVYDRVEGVTYFWICLAEGLVNRSTLTSDLVLNHRGEIVLLRTCSVS